MSRISASVAAAAIAIASSACSDVVYADPPTGDSAGPVGTLTDVQATAKRLNDARNSIQTQTGASAYTIDAAAIAAVPGGDNTLLNQVIMQAPEQDFINEISVVVNDEV